jgi:hypothetical protein
MMKKLAFFSLVILVFASGCREISSRRERGSGNIQSQNRSVSSFNSVDVSGAIDIYVKQDSVSSVKVEADDNILQYVEVHVDGSTLQIYTSGGIRLRPSRKIKVYIGNPVYQSLEASGACSINGESPIVSTGTLRISLTGASDGNLEIDAPRVMANVTGASNVNLRGRTKDFEADASGASGIDSFGLLTENTQVDLSGASHAEVFASVSLGGNASGASHVDYKGNASVSVSKSGASSVNKKQ